MVATLFISSNAATNITLLGVSMWCYNCLSTFLTDLAPGMTADVEVDVTSFPYKLSTCNIINQRTSKWGLIYIKLMTQALKIPLQVSC